MSSASEPLTEENTNAFAHRIAGDSLVYECPNCEFGEVLVTELIESDDARCLDCGTRYRLHVESVE
ncbi:MULTISPECIES: hypothetical protein [Haloferax]|uniref:Small CPxCG-related zinc finger protein n=1 Tax=Haloferax gibbonsii TaxID=35746 RepID=A0A0K1IRA3_HALGI|nr:MULTISPECIES: hypothetical protein [Haloferax]AKU06991.1 hypothetical protein ABY42_04250 [Haloferax gibbonsii]QOS11041.1 small CPxCG-related zinc finger protein [Haloferax gibbonsii]RDZ43466.1 hypothetical protein C5B86_10475 [Haloferax sp. Atlit-19N]RDZ46636.1 hypothetical protein C5B87_02910 [Haloferax sp. Atlit-16N]RDZ54845.1 hypothetical protein C5C07_04820 [Haloferax sp. Atlit-4N]